MKPEINIYENFYGIENADGELYDISFEIKYYPFTGKVKVSANATVHDCDGDYEEKIL